MNIYKWRARSLGPFKFSLANFQLTWIVHIDRGEGGLLNGYRDVKLSVVYEVREDIRIIGEIQVRSGWGVG
jgi:hypothetical protein